MTSRQRVEAALCHREPDWTPIFEYVLLWPMADRLMGRPCCDCEGGRHGWAALIQELGWEAAVYRYATDQLEIALRLGHDMMYIVPNPPPPRPAGQDRGPAPSPAGPVERLWQRNQAASKAPPPDEGIFLVYHLLKDRMAARDVDLPLLAPAYAHGVWTDADLMQTMVLEAEVAHNHFSLATGRSLAMIAQYATIGVDQVGVGGDFSGNRPILSPAMYREFIMPEVRAVSRSVHAAGMRAVNASDGNLWSVIEEFLIGCEVDGYLEIDLYAGMDLRELKRRYGDRITLYGNIDCGNLLTFGTPSEIRHATIECLEAGDGRGGHIFCVSNAITSSVPLENYLAMVNTYREMFGLGTWRR